MKTCLQLLCGIFSAVALVICAAAHAADSPSPVAVETNVGVEGVYYVRCAAGTLAARPVDERSPIVLRIAGVVRDGEGALYEVRYIGSRAGEHDLRDYLLQAGEPAAASLPPLLLRVHETLPPDHDGSLAALPPTRPRLSWHYRLLMGAALLAWMAVTLLLIARRLGRSRPRRFAVPQVAPTLADQLRPLVEAALAGGLPPAGQARLEALLLAHWRSVLSLGRLPPDEALRKMRLHDEAGRLLRELERWLHDRPGRHQVNVAGLLAPYRAAAAREEKPLLATIGSA